MKLITAIFPFLLLTFLLGSCVDDPKKETETIKTKPKEIDPQLLVGKWILTGATINRVPTSRLDSAYFDFVNSSEIKTNILGEETTGTYSISVKEKKMTHDIGRNIDYKIEKLVSDSMILSMNINSKRYRVLFQK